ncbi:MAG: HD domain-containing protein [Desulfobacteraceae bacterium]|nr:MAG: HD domain-containing protein [Desulfobacteraceae bacterium]
MNLPDQKECYRIMARMTMPDHIKDHCRMVCRVASFLGCSLQPIYPGINLRLAAVSALLHDITKFQSFSTGEMHSETGKTLIQNMGYPEVADIIRQHVILDRYTLGGPVTEVEIVNYSDKRILHDRIVSLDERLTYIQEKYGDDRAMALRVDMMWKNSKMLEDKIFRHLNFSPRALGEQIQARVVPSVDKL